MGQVFRGVPIEIGSGLFCFLHLRSLRLHLRADGYRPLPQRRSAFRGSVKKQINILVFRDFLTSQQIIVYIAVIKYDRIAAKSKNYI